MFWAVLSDLGAIHATKRMEENENGGVVAASATMLNSKNRHALFFSLSSLSSLPLSTKRLPRPSSRSSLTLTVAHSPFPIRSHTTVSQALCSRRRQPQRRDVGLPGRECSDDGGGVGERQRWSSRSRGHPIPPAPGRQQAPAQVHGQARVVRARRRARNEAHVCTGEYGKRAGKRERERERRRRRRRCSMRAQLSLTHPFQRRRRRRRTKKKLLSSKQTT